jgi:peptide-methionine (S)-S-oxide reductase
MTSFLGRHKGLLLGGAAMLGAGSLMLRGPAQAEDMRLVPPPATDVAPATAVQTAVLSGGCFWGVQGVFEHVKGVTHVVAGYSGGAPGTADYESVSTGTTGHAESVQVSFDPRQITYGQILQIFFSVALDPTMKNAQGPDSGTQYRSEVFYVTPEQQKVAQAYIAQLDGAHVFPKPIATRVDPMHGFYPAEAYHQDFLVNHPDYPYIVYNDMPKVEALKRIFPARYMDQARTTDAKS